MKKHVMSLLLASLFVAGSALAGEAPTVSTQKSEPAKMKKVLFKKGGASTRREVKPSSTGTSELADTLGTRSTKAVETKRGK